MKTTNRREEYTKRAIRESLAELLMKKPIEKISVAELCELADVNRSTFYRHYTDLYALLDTVIEECLREIFHDAVANLNHDGDFDADGYHYILQICAVTEKNKAIYKALLFGHTGTHFMQRVVDAVLELYLGAHEPSSLVPAPEVRVHYKYHVHGIIGIWSEWVREDCSFPKEEIAYAAKEQTRAFFYKMNELFLPQNYNRK